MQPTIIGILGKPLAGKDTVAAALCDAGPHVARISMGATLAEVKATGETHRFWPILRDAIMIAESGGIVPGEPINLCMEALISEQLEAGKKHIIWIAGPRNEEELIWLDTWAKEKGIHTQFLHVDVPDSEVYDRLDGRKEGRVDDTRDILHVRLDNFRTITKPVIDRLRNEGRLIEISGLGGKEIVGKRSVEALQMHDLDPERSLPAMARR